MCALPDDEHTPCAVCVELEAAANAYAALCEVPLEGVVMSRVRGESRTRAFGAEFRPDLMR